MANFLDDFEFEAKKSERRGGPKGKRPRDDDQKPWDDAVKAAHDAGRPFAVQITPEEAGDARRRVVSAFRFHEIAGTEGVAKPGNEEGTVILAWKTRVPKLRGPRTKVVEQSDGELFVETDEDSAE